MKKLSIEESLVKILGRPNVASRTPIYEKYDKNVQGNTVHERGQVAASVITPFRDFPELSEDKSVIGVSVGTGGNPYQALIDPRLAAEYAICQATLCVSCVGGEPLGATDCLNFGNPEKENQMAELVEGIEGIKIACETLSIPIVSGNVSLYNESSGKSVPPSALVSVFARVDDVKKVKPLYFKTPNTKIWYLGQGSTLSGSEFLNMMKTQDTNLPSINYKKFSQLILDIKMILKKNEVESIAQVLSGGVWAAVFQSATQNNIGFRLNFEENLPPNIFGEGLGVIVSSNSDLSNINGAVCIGETLKSNTAEVFYKNKLISSLKILDLKKSWEKSLREVF